jgi:ADP-ribosyl-[dinitrogen reductase] hydrolase
MQESQIIGCLLGTAIGDAIGLPYEGLSRRRGVRLLGSPTHHRFFFGKGMMSDDTEHTCLVTQSLIASGQNDVIFKQQLSWRLRCWLLGLPAGVGLATLKSIVRLWCGMSPDKSGVFSAGNGPAMRSAILGVAIADLHQLRTFVRISSRMTHTDPKAEYGAFAIALAARMICENSAVSGDHFLHQLDLTIGQEASELITLIQKGWESSQQGDSTPEFAQKLGFSKGVSGYVYQTVPIALHAWFRHPQDFQQAIVGVVECGGDTDSVAAIVGGLIGTGVGEFGIPAEWRKNLIESPRSIDWMRSLGFQLSNCLHENQTCRPLRLSIVQILLRNLFFLVIVLGHGFRRLLPPY